MDDPFVKINFEELINNLNDIVYVLDKNGDFVYVSPSVEKVSGYRPDELIGKDFSLVVAPEDLATVRDNFKKTLRGIYTPREFKAVMKNGEGIYVRSFSRLLKKGDNVIGITGVLTNIDEAKRMEEGLRRGERKYRLLTENAPLGIFSIDAKGNILDINKKMSGILGLPVQGRPGGMNFFDFPALFESGISDDAKYALDKGKPIVKTRKYISDWGKEIYIRIHLQPVSDDADRVVGLQGVAEDVTSSVNAQEKAKDAFLQVENAKKEWEITVDALPQIICLMDSQGVILRSNKAIERWRVGKVEDAKGKNMHSFLHQGKNCDSCEFGIFWDQAWRDVLDGKIIRREFKDKLIGKDFYLEIYPINGNSEKKAMAVISDITEVSKSKRKIMDLFKYLGLVNRRIAVLVNMGKKGTERSAQGIYSFIINSAMNVSNVHACGLYLYDRDEKLFELLSSKNYSSGEGTNLESLPLGLEFIKKLKKNKKRVQGSLNDNDFDRLSLSRVKYYLAVPFTQDNKIIGMIVLGFKDKDDLSTQELDFYELFSILTTSIFLRAIDK